VLVQVLYKELINDGKQDDLVEVREQHYVRHVHTEWSLQARLA
jgi:hypothetical protein